MAKKQQEVTVLSSTEFADKDSLEAAPPSNKIRWIEAALIIGFWAFLFALELAQDAFDSRRPQGLTHQEVARSGVEYLLWLCLTPLIFGLISKFNFERDIWYRHLGVHVFFGMGIIFLTQAYSHFSFIAYVWRGNGSPPTYLGSLLAFRFMDELILYLSVLAAGFARNYFYRYRKHLEETVQLRTEAVLLRTQLVEARLQALRMQLNPHFLFNTLNAISTLVERDPKGVRKVIARLSELLRYTLDEENAQEVPLHRELQFLRSYFDIQKIRFQGRLSVEEIVDEAVRDALVPSLILQPIAENAIKHGISRVLGQGHIEVVARKEGNDLKLTIRDNGPGVSEGAEAGISKGNGTTNFSEHIGLRNTRERLSELYGDKASLHLESPVEGGAVATITLPFHTQQDLASVAI